MGNPAEETYCYPNTVIIKVITQMSTGPGANFYTVAYSGFSGNPPRGFRLASAQGAKGAMELKIFRVRYRLRGLRAALYRLSPRWVRQRCKFNIETCAVAVRICFRCPDGLS